MKKSLAELAGTDESTWRLRDHANVLYSLFPNGALLVQPARSLQLSPRHVHEDLFQGLGLTAERHHGKAGLDDFTQ